MVRARFLVWLTVHFISNIFCFFRLKDTLSSFNDGVLCELCLFQIARLYLKKAFVDYQAINTVLLSLEDHLLLNFLLFSAFLSAVRFLESSLLVFALLFSNYLLKLFGTFEF